MLIAQFMPHGHCYLWTPSMVWLQVVTDLLIGVAYFSIPLILIKVLRARSDIPFDRVLLGFAIFILACGTTHFMEVWNVWHADYWLAGVVKGVTAVASVSTALFLYRAQPELLRFPSPKQLQELNAGLEKRVTEIKQAEESRRASEELFRTSFEFAGTGMAIASLHGRWLEVNQRVCQIVGYTEEELLQKEFQDITHPEDRALEQRQMQALLAGDRSHYQLEKRYVHRNGQTVWVRVTAALVRNSEGAPLHFVSQIEDITDRKLLEVDLAKTQQKRWRRRG